jgi:hypothetical protein
MEVRGIRSFAVHSYIGEVSQVGLQVSGALIEDKAFGLTKYAQINSIYLSPYLHHVGPRTVAAADFEPKLCKRFQTVRQCFQFVKKIDLVSSILLQCCSLLRFLDRVCSFMMLESRAHLKRPWTIGN